MSWIDKVNTDLVIITGDGVEYRPKWINAVKDIEYNVSEFTFISLPGSYVDRKEVRGRKFPVEIIFDGEDHLAISEQFEFSAKNKKPWEVHHPMYGTIKCHPTSLRFDNSSMNVSKISGVLFETILLTDVELINAYPLQTFKSVWKDADAIASAKLLQLEKLNVSERKTLLRGLESTYKIASKYLIDNDASALYRNKFNKLTAEVSKVTYDLSEIAKSIHEFSVLPYTLIDDIDQRMKAIKEQLDVTFDNVSTLFTRKSKRLYENETGFKIIGLALSALDNVGEYYENSVIISSVIDFLYEYWNRYNQTLELLSTDHEGTLESFIPDYDLSKALGKIISLAITSLMDMLKSSKRERVIILQEDESMINLVKRIYGLDANDVNIDKFIKQNNIGLGEILLLKRDRKILYYI